MDLLFILIEYGIFRSFCYQKMIYTYKNRLKCRYLVFYYQGLRKKRKNGHVSFNIELDFVFIVMFHWYRDDTRVSDEARNHFEFILANFPAPKGLDLKAMRQRSEDVHGKINEKLLGQFQGVEEERQIRIDETTGWYFRTFH